MDRWLPLLTLLVFATERVSCRTTQSAPPTTIQQQTIIAKPKGTRQHTIKTPAPPHIPPIVTQCFYESKWYPAGAVINAGRRGNLCYGAFCDLDGHTKHWSNSNCPKPDPLNPEPPFPDLSKQTTTPRPTPAPVTKPPFNYQGCFYGEKFYFPGENISMEKSRGMCTGLVCDLNSQVNVFVDYCMNSFIPFPLDIT